MWNILTSLPVIAFLCWLPVGVLWLVMWWRTRRDRRQREVQEQIWAMERAICDEMLPDWQREAIEEAAQQRRDIAREARRRLGLPEKEEP